MQNKLVKVLLLVRLASGTWIQGSGFSALWKVFDPHSFLPVFPSLPPYKIYKLNFKNYVVLLSFNSIMHLTYF